MVIPDLRTAEKKYDLILADPPWQQKKGDSKRARINTSGKPLDYPTLSLPEISEHLLWGSRLLSNGGGYCSYGL